MTDKTFDWIEMTQTTTAPIIPHAAIILPSLAFLGLLKNFNPPKKERIEIKYVPSNNGTLSNQIWSDVAGGSSSLTNQSIPNADFFIYISVVSRMKDCPVTKR